jgi:hypothetical protein
MLMEAGYDVVRHQTRPATHRTGSRDGHIHARAGQPTVEYIIYAIYA